ncbi:beta-lactamase (plasmid) [Gemmatirosa kalamazoonensis]|uniref:Beta-lactamase n=1 Tax=Gemmatirosa kalamazoonensis TaxID=861299 RepID=W0RNY4_9BACT|nr:serine hydrolase [Gemmatirosa kalamazoonensis]AHG92456.1 beta-lactamase [Gemmatirosa kalamazoonensis]
MRRTLLPVALLLAATPVAAQSGAGLDSIFRAYARTDGPGCAVGVSRKGEPLVERAYGMADLEHDVPNTPRTVFEAGSVSKQFTAGAVVLLALDGKLSLDDDVRRWLPELPDYGTPITIRHLLNHTSGLRDWGSVAELGGWPRGTRAYTNDLVLDIARHQRALNYTPGQYYSYTNTGYNLLALIVGRVSGKPLAEFTRERIFQPLGMTQTSWRDDFTRVVKGRAIAYARAGAGGYRMDMPFENAHGNGGLLTTPADLLKWTANLETGALGGPRFLEEMHRQARLNGGRTLEYASGLVVTRFRGVPEVDHSGATAGYRAFLTRFPTQGLAIAVLCNDGTANPTALAHATAAAYLGDALQPVTPAVRATLVAASVDGAGPAAFVGTYRSTRDGAPLRLVVTNGQLRLSTGAVVTLDSSAHAPTTLRLVTADGDTLRYEATAPFTPTAARLAEYAGTYESDEVDGTIVVTVDGTGLRLADRYGRVQRTAPPLYTDTFGDASGHVRFVRDGRGRVTGLSVRESRAWDVRFRRTR